MRDRVGIVDLTAFTILDVTGPGALQALQRLAVAEIDVPVGRVVYTPLLNAAGGIRADLTIMRLGPETFRVVTGAGSGQVDRKWIADHLPADGSAQLTDVTSSWCTLGLWGPRARDLLGSLTADDVSHEGFGFATCRSIELGPLPVLASRLSYVGELGWELYAPIETGARLWDLVWEAGRDHGVVPVGIGAYLTPGRLEKSYRAHGAELDLEHDLVEAGMARRTVKEADFVGRDAYLLQREGDPAAVLCTLTVEDRTSSAGERRAMMGREPILTRDGEPLVDARGRRSYVTSAGSGPSVGAVLLMSYLPVERAEVGAELAVAYLGERHPVHVAVVGSTPLFDPDDARMKG
jgi:glycine cleavage system aminomethyltransferase T